MTVDRRLSGAGFDPFEDSLGRRAQLTQLRPPTILAKAAASLSVLTGGRIALGVGGVVDFLGAQHTIGGYSAGPVPPAPVPLWLGSQGPRMLAVTGRSSDGWISPLSTYLTPQAVPSRQQLIDEAALSAGRDPAALRRIYNVVGALGAVRGGPGLTGDVQSWVDALTDWSVDLGFDTFIFWPTSAPLPQLELFATDVVPGVRQRVRERRGQR